MLFVVILDSQNYSQYVLWANVGNHDFATNSRHDGGEIKAKR
jgi:hypothetical protein